MKQLLQSLRTGASEIVDVPCPAFGRGEVLIETSQSLISAGTERMLVDFGKAGWIAKARQQPDKVRQVLDKVRTDGLAPTLDAVRTKLDQPMPLGYCNVGRVVAVGSEVSRLSIGERVASNGRHAEMVSVPANLCARVPEGVEDEAAAFAVLGAIALQGVRLAAPTLGEAVVVIGLGLVGLLTVQLLRAHGCRVLGLDFDAERAALARRLGAETVDLSAGADPLARAAAFSRGRGMDAVIIAASTQSDEPMRQAAAMCRKRGRIVLVGVTGLQLSRADFYEKELTFQVSCSYGPGRYDPAYEEGGQDYPVGFVRWTEQRNFEAVLDMMADGRLDVTPLISHRFALEEAGKAYELISGAEPSLGVLLRYRQSEGGAAGAARIRSVRTAAERPSGGRPRIGIVGAGGFASSTLVPAFAASGGELCMIASKNGANSVHLARKFSIPGATTDLDALFGEPALDAVVVATRHDSHADLVCRALEARKHVFVEKPLALTSSEIDRIEAARGEAETAGFTPLVMVGFNRRFAPQTVKMKALLAPVSEPKAFLVTVNAGALPPGHWLNDPKIGGGRIVGEACHFVDLLRHLAGHPITEARAQALPGGESASITLRFADGSIGTVQYMANGSKSFPKERVEIFAAGRVLQLDNFRRLRGYGWPGFSRMDLWRQDKGHRAGAAAFVEALDKGGEPIAFEEILEVSRTMVRLSEDLRR